MKNGLISRVLAQAGKAVESRSSVLVPLQWKIIILVFFLFAFVAIKAAFGRLEIVAGALPPAESPACRLQWPTVRRLNRPAANNLFITSQREFCHCAHPFAR